MWMENSVGPDQLASGSTLFSISKVSIGLERGSSKSAHA